MKSNCLACYFLVGSIKDYFAQKVKLGPTSVAFTSPHELLSTATNYIAKDSYVFHLPQRSPYATNPNAYLLYIILYDRPSSPTQVLTESFEARIHRYD